MREVLGEAHGGLCRGGVPRAGTHQPVRRDAHGPAEHDRAELRGLREGGDARPGPGGRWHRDEVVRNDLKQSIAVLGTEIDCPLPSS